MAISFPFESCFPRARLYAGLPPPGRVRESAGRGWIFPHSERHLQCVWFDEALRPPRLVTHQGEEVTVEDPGVWNLEAGPDFLGAALRIGPDQRRITGDVELHIHPSGWKLHGHASDPRYARVRVHVTYFPGSVPPDALPAGAIQIALKDALAASPSFSFENVDLTAYPFATRAAVPPCQTEFKAWNADRKQSVLDAAGEERLRRKAERMALRIAEKDRGQVLYEEVLAALGFKNNKAPFRHLAVSLPHDELRTESAGRPLVAYALLAGVSGLLPATPSAQWDTESRAFARRVWDEWWKRRDAFSSRILARSEWSLGGIRPVNHPLRRLMAAALLFSGKQSLADRWSRASWDKMIGSLAELRHDYFDRRATIGGIRLKGTTALIGPDRAEAIGLNVWVPFMAAIEEGPALGGGLLDILPPEKDNAVIRQTANSLFGADHGPSLYRSGLRRQGLIQIFHDYCLNDRSRCASCTFPALLKAHSGDSHAHRDI